MQQASRGAANAREQDPRRTRIRSKAEVRCQAVRARSEYSAAAVRCRQTEQGLGYRHYLHPDLGRLAVPGCRHGSFSRKIVGWAVAPTIGRGLVLDAVLMAVRRRRPKKTIIHSDQGSQYGSDDWRRFCKTNGLIPSMSRRGNCWDNAVAESFFSSLKKGAHQEEDLQEPLDRPCRDRGLHRGVLQIQPDGIVTSTSPRFQ